jgi:hypothetical protein
MLAGCFAICAANIIGNGKLNAVWCFGELYLESCLRTLLFCSLTVRRGCRRGSTCLRTHSASTSTSRSTVLVFAPSVDFCSKLPFGQTRKTCARCPRRSRSASPPTPLTLRCACNVSDTPSSLLFGLTQFASHSAVYNATGVASTSKQLFFLSSRLSILNLSPLAAAMSVVSLQMICHGELVFPLSDRCLVCVLSRPAL